MSGRALLKPHASQPPSNETVSSRIRPSLCHSQRFHDISCVTVLPSKIFTNAIISPQAKRKHQEKKPQHPYMIHDYTPVNLQPTKKEAHSQSYPIIPELQS
ncbi:hypothetical protein BDP55DRAFT_666075 [Colletotrichum godetiae]|uniref:Uncharacterized protein n=1 Tax=Colletotrichum godetiae TaxID=1209918 RepID=A0AAJ0ET79_9PEZI|nr:uncharacterized protein BDP55DRAFT_666075 [Colletotrichum godetiae]KAK1674737.1 hypothetical protein BDP55DRAFT_666075 [Colletotrichum godetiae]